MIVSFFSIYLELSVIVVSKWTCLIHTSHETIRELVVGMVVIEVEAAMEEEVAAVEVLVEEFPTMRKRVTAVTGLAISQEIAQSSESNFFKFVV